MAATPVGVPQPLLHDDRHVSLPGDSGVLGRAVPSAVIPGGGRRVVERELHTSEKDSPAYLAKTPLPESTLPRLIFPTNPEGVLRVPSASDHRRTSVPAPTRFSTSSHIGFSVVAYGFQSSS